MSMNFNLWSIFKYKFSHFVVLFTPFNMEETHKYPHILTYSYMVKKCAFTSPNSNDDGTVGGIVLKSDNAFESLGKLKLCAQSTKCMHTSTYL